MMFHQLRLIFAGVRQNAGTKLLCYLGLGGWMALFYYAPQLWPLFPAQPAPALAVDEWIPFQPQWAVAYQSVFLVHTLALWLPQDRRVVKAYAQTLAAAYALSAIVFWFYPTLSPRPEQSGSMLHAWLICAIDGQRNAFPSLHATMGFLAVVTLARDLHACRVSRWWCVALALWSVALLYSTLATRQHRLLDLLAGIALGGILLAWSAFFIRTRRHHDSILVSADHPPVI